jgi:methylated-DNA-[protein]-cysteine S-methyltransferase
VSYGEIARRIGSAARPVGVACGANPIPILIPCHRVVAADGRLTGYSGGDGIKTKQALLGLEDPGQADLFDMSGACYDAQPKARRFDA